MTEAELQAIEERPNAATPLPWTLAEKSLTILAPDGSALAHCFHGSPDRPEVFSQAQRDVRFLLLSRTDVPALITYVRDLQAALRDAELRGVQGGLEAAAKGLHKRALWHLGDMSIWGWRTIAEQLDREANAIRALDPAKVLEQVEVVADMAAVRFREAELHGVQLGLEAAAKAVEMHDLEYIAEQFRTMDPAKVLAEAATSERPPG